MCNSSQQYSSSIAKQSKSVSHHFPTKMASGQGPGVNYLRQEIRGFMVLDGANANSSSSSSSSATTTTTTTTNTTSSNSSTSGAASAAQQLVQSLPSETTTPASANLSNRLSRLPAQLQQQHFKNLWKHYRKHYHFFKSPDSKHPFSLSVRAATEGAHPEEGHLPLQHLQPTGALRQRVSL